MKTANVGGWRKKQAPSKPSSWSQTLSGLLALLGCCWWLLLAPAGSCWLLSLLLWTPAFPELISMSKRPNPCRLAQSPVLARPKSPPEPHSSPRSNPTAHRASSAPVSHLHLLLLQTEFRQPTRRQHTLCRRDASLLPLPSPRLPALCLQGGHGNHKLETPEPAVSAVTNPQPSLSA